MNLRQLVTLLLIGAVSIAPLAAQSAPVRDRDSAVPMMTLPSNAIQRTITNFGESLSCMDELLLQYGKTGIRVIADEIPDKTETLNAGTRDMLISTLDSMSVKSRAFTFVDADSADVNITQFNPDVTMPDYYIKGSITAVDKQSVTQQKKFGISFSPASAGIANDRQVSQIAMDLGMYKVQGRTALPGVRTRNTVLLVQSGKGADMEGLLPFASLLFSVSKDVNEGQGAAIRSLLELSLIELLGKFTKVPYWQCLSLPSADPLAMRTATEYFNRMTVRERVAATQTALARAGLYAGPVDGTETSSLLMAVSRYRAENELGAGTSIDAPLYFSFLTRGLPARADDPRLTSTRPPPASLQAQTDPDRFTFQMNVRNTVSVNEPVRLSLKANKDAYFYCYVSGSSNDTAFRVYPNKFTGDQPLTPADQTLLIPAGNFTLSFDRVGKEEIACIARTEPYRQPFPPSLTVAALQDEIQTQSTLSGVGAVINEHQTRDPRGLHSAVRRIVVNVVANASD